jgi:hypothetical protein
MEISLAFGFHGNGIPTNITSVTALLTVIICGYYVNIAGGVSMAVSLINPRVSIPVWSQVGLKNAEVIKYRRAAPTVERRNCCLLGVRRSLMSSVCVYLIKNSSPPCRLWSKLNRMSQRSGTNIRFERVLSSPASLRKKKYDIFRKAIKSFLYVIYSYLKKEC